MNFFGGRNWEQGARDSRADKFAKFSDRARRVLSLAQQEAQSFNHNYIGTEHLLLGLIRENEGIAALVLAARGVEVERVRAMVVHIIGRGDRIVLGEIGLTPRAKKVVELAVDEARRMNHHYVGTEHLLLGLIREGEGIAAGVLTSLGLSLAAVRAATLAMSNAGGSGAQTAPAGGQESASARPGGASGSSSGFTGSAPGGPKTNVVACRLDDATLDAIDALVEAGIRNTRSDAAAWLIGAGIEAHQALFDRVNATVIEIRQLRAEAQAIAQQVRQEAANGGGDIPTPTAAADAPAEGFAADAASGGDAGEPGEQPPATPPEASPEA